MPNWCEGILKLRGNKKDLINFVMNVLERYGYQNIPIDFVKGADKLPLQEEYTEYGDLYITENVELENGNSTWIYFKDSRRVFLTKNIEWYFNTQRDEPDGEQYIQVLDIKQAWDIDTEYFVELSKQYHLDIKIDCFELGMKFSRKIEIIQGDIVCDETLKYDDYNWEVYDPRLGG